MNGKLWNFKKSKLATLAESFFKKWSLERTATQHSNQKINVVDNFNATMSKVMYETACH